MRTEPVLGTDSRYGIGSKYGIGLDRYTIAAGHIFQASLTSAAMKRHFVRQVQESGSSSEESDGDVVEPVKASVPQEPQEPQRRLPKRVFKQVEIENEVRIEKEAKINKGFEESGLAELAELAELSEGLTEELAEELSEGLSELSEELSDSGEPIQRLRFVSKTKKRQVRPPDKTAGKNHAISYIEKVIKSEAQAQRILRENAQEDLGGIDDTDDVDLELELKQWQERERDRLESERRALEEQQKEFEERDDRRLSRVKQATS